MTPRQRAYSQIADAARLSVGAGQCDDPDEMILRFVLWAREGCLGSPDDALGVAEEKTLSKDKLRHRNRLMRELWARFGHDVGKAYRRLSTHRVGRRCVPGTIEELCEEIRSLDRDLIGARQFRRIVTRAK
jgi:hypothetical protein